MKRLIAAFIGMTLFLGGCGSASATENNTEVLFYRNIKLFDSLYSPQHRNARTFVVNCSSAEKLSVSFSQLERRIAPALACGNSVKM